jgi:serine protease Do
MVTAGFAAPGLLAGVGRASAQEPAPAPAGLATVAALEDALVNAIARAERSVVSIARVDPTAAPGVAAEDVRRRPLDPFPMADLTPPGPTDPDFIPHEFGTGVIVDRAGLVVTNAHVVDEKCEHWIYTADRRVFRAKIKGLDARSDLAILEIERADDAGTAFEPIVLGDAAGLRKGQFVAALGNPYAIARDGQASASWGIVSNLSRKSGPLPATDGESDGKDTLHHFGTLIQTDCRLNLGTSGGALINLKGEMIGLTTSTAAIAGYEQAAGFAIPVDDIFRRALEALKKGEEVEFGFLGISRDNLMADERLRGRTGVRVKSVQANTPAAKAGLVEDDVILAIDGRPLFDTDALMLALASMPPATQVELSVERRPRDEKGRLVPRPERKQLQATLAKYRVRGRQVVTAPRKKWRGLRVDYATAFPSPFRGFESGVVVLEVESGSPADRAGLRAQDVISLVETVPVETPDQFLREAGRRKGVVSLKRRSAAGEEQVVRVRVE